MSSYLKRYAYLIQFDTDRPESITLMLNTVFKNEIGFAGVVIMGEYDILSKSETD